MKYCIQLVQKWLYLIELIWAQVKDYVARNNTTFNIKDAKRLLVEVVQSITSEQWQKCIKPDIVLWRRKYLREIKKHRAEGKTIYVPDKTWVNSMEEVADVVINLGYDDSSESN